MASPNPRRTRVSGWVWPNSEICWCGQGRTRCRPPKRCVACPCRSGSTTTTTSATTRPCSSSNTTARRTEPYANPARQRHHRLVTFQDPGTTIDGARLRLGPPVQVPSKSPLSARSADVLQASVDRERRAGDERGVGPSEEHDRAAYVGFGVTHSSERHRGERSSVRLGIIALPLVHRGGSSEREHHIGAD